MPSLAQAKLYLAQLDLSYVTAFMASERYPLPRWTLADAEACGRLYKNFLWLNKKYPDQALVPSKEIDEYWHNHILYTRLYVRDCGHIFGHYLHHEPQGLDEDPQSLIDQYIHTKALYLAEFGEAMK